MASKLKQVDASITTNGTNIFTSKDCDSAVNFLPALEFQLARTLSVSIPPAFYTQKADGGSCLLLFEINNEADGKYDPIVNPQSGEDIDTNTGYMLGMPFLRSFMLLFDFEDNRIGLAEKTKNFGAIIVGHVIDDSGDDEKGKDSDDTGKQEGPK